MYQDGGIRSYNDDNGLPWCDVYTKFNINKSHWLIDY